MLRKKPALKKQAQQIFKLEHKRRIIKMEARVSGYSGLWLRESLVNRCVYYKNKQVSSSNKL